jgi:hypothetical protein
MGKLYEILAVEPQLKAEAMQALGRLKGLFSDGKNRFRGQMRTYAPLEENGEQQPDENSNMATTVDYELKLLSQYFSRWIDAAMQKEVSNQDTSADVVIDGEVIFSQLPAPALLNLEGKLGELRAVYSLIPVNDPSETWQFDNQLSCFVSRNRVTYKTKKVLRAQVLSEATKEHPAQVDTFTEDIRIGEWTTVIHSGMLTPAAKQQKLDRINMLLQAVKVARQRANAVEVKPISVADKLFDFINRE